MFFFGRASRQVQRLAFLRYLRELVHGLALEGRFVLTGSFKFPFPLEAANVIFRGGQLRGTSEPPRTLYFPFLLVCRTTGGFAAKSSNDFATVQVARLDCEGNPVIDRVH